MVDVSTWTRLLLQLSFFSRSPQAPGYCIRITAPSTHVLDGKCGSGRFVYNVVYVSM